MAENGNGSHVAKKPNPSNEGQIRQQPSSAIPKHAINSSGQPTPPFGSSEERGLVNIMKEPSLAIMSRSLPPSKSSDRKYDQKQFLEDQKKIAEMQTEIDVLTQKLNFYTSTLEEIRVAQSRLEHRVARHSLTFKKREEEVTSAAEADVEVKNPDSEAVVEKGEEEYRETIRDRPIVAEPKHHKPSIYIINRTHRPDGEYEFIVWDALCINSAQMKSFKETCEIVFPYALRKFEANLKQDHFTEKKQNCTYCQECLRRGICFRTVLLNFILKYFETVKNLVCLLTPPKRTSRSGNTYGCSN